MKPLTADKFREKWTPDGRKTTLKYCAEFEVRTALNLLKIDIQKYIKKSEKGLIGVTPEYKHGFESGLNQALYLIDESFPCFKPKIRRYNDGTT